MIAEKLTGEESTRQSMSSAEFHELIDALAENPRRIAAQLGNLSGADLRGKKDEAEFSALENICHLRDIEVEGYTVRINRILTEEKPFLPDIDGGRLAVDRNYSIQDSQESLDAFALARMQNVRTLRNLSPEQLNREGILEGVGPITLEKLLLMMRDHDEGHLQAFTFTGRAEK